jgi:hypothetical protein
MPHTQPGEASYNQHRHFGAEIAIRRLGDFWGIA